MWAVGGAIVIMLYLLKIIWNTLNDNQKIMWNALKDNQKELIEHMNQLENRLSTQISNLDKRVTDQLNRIDEKSTNIDRRLCRLEGAFASKAGCMISDSQYLKKAE